MAPAQVFPKTCHNCRRQRLKCDSSLPQCLKCINRGQECLGYQRLLRWEQSIASRGKRAGLTFEKMEKARARQQNSSPQLPSPASQDSSCDTETLSLDSLTDPLIQDMNHTSRKYLLYFASDVCKDLVLYDVPNHNPFRDLIPLTPHFPVLLQIIIASSALHMSNAGQKSFVSVANAKPLCHPTGLSTTPCMTASAIHRQEFYEDALAAKQQALYLLKFVLTNVALIDIDVILAVVLLFVEFELIDSGRDNWKHHINGARTIIGTLCDSKVLAETAMTPLRSCLISNFLIFDILGSTLTSSSVPRDTFPVRALTLLEDAEGNHCSSLPTILLHLIRAGDHLVEVNHISSPHFSMADSKQKQALFLLQTAQSFDPHAWATNLQPRSPACDLMDRTHVAFAHRAAVCIYLSRVYLSLCPTTRLLHDLESLVADIISHLSFIKPSSALFTATTWPAFIAGAETKERTRQEWVAQRFRELWEVEPWGLIKGAVEILEGFWEGRRNEAATNGEGSLVKKMRGDGDWIGELKRSGVDWLIL